MFEEEKTISNPSKSLEQDSEQESNSLAPQHPEQSRENGRVTRLLAVLR